MRAPEAPTLTMDLDTHSKLAGRDRRIPPVLLEKARQLRRESTSAEVILWSCVRNRQLNGFKFRRQHNLGQFIVDFYCHNAQLIIEIDGSIHQTPDQIQRDQQRDHWILQRGFKILRFTNSQVQRNLPQVLLKILNILDPESMA